MQHHPSDGSSLNLQQTPAAPYFKPRKIHLDARKRLQPHHRKYKLSYPGNLELR